MADVVALDLAPGAAFVEALRRVWDAGDAVFPLDDRLARPAAEALLAAVRPRWIIGPDGERRQLDHGRPSEPGDALVVATSGTTGRPRAAVLTHDAVIASARTTSRRLEVTGSDRWLACLPLAHVGGLSVVTRALVTDVPLTVLPGFDAAAVEAEAANGATLVSLVPTALRRIDPYRFRRIVLGGSAPPEALPSNTVMTYGMTETGSGVVYDGVPLDGVEVRVDDTGQIHLRGPMLLRAYRDGTDPKDGDGWLATGDIGAIDEDGRLQVRGRRGDLIITGGENVWPDPVEAVLARHPAVAEVAVAGVPDADWGQRVVAYVVPTDPAAPPSLDELRGLVRAELAAFCAPRELVVVGDLPRTSLGKVRRSALRTS